MSKQRDTFSIVLGIALFTVLALIIMTCRGHASETPLTQKARFAEAMQIQSADPTKAFGAMQDLSDEGYARATDRLAYFTLKGIGTQADMQAAIALYEQAVADGRRASLVSLGKVYMMAGAHENAVQALQKASDAGFAKADDVLAWAHATGRLGPLSDRAAGFARLTELADAGSKQGATYLLDAAVRNNRTPANIDTVLDALHARHTNGDAKAAEALLRYYRAARHPRGTIDLRAELLETDGLRDKIRVEEALYLARDRQPRIFWTVSEELVQGAPKDVYARALSVAARINRNAYVRIVQKELRAHGYPVGPKSPYMTKRLIKSLNAFCRDTGLNEACAAGPLKSTTIKAVAGKLADMRVAL